MLQLNLEEKKASSPISSPRSDNKDDDKNAFAPLSATKRKLVEAKQKDAYFDKEVKAIESTLIVKEISRKFVAEALTAAFSLQSPRRDEKK